jgi:hypothetical protein
MRNFKTRKRGKSGRVPRLRFGLVCGPAQFGLVTLSLVFIAISNADHSASAQPRLSSAREMLELAGVGPTQLSQLVDRRPLEADEPETLWKILYHFPRFGRDPIEAWATAGQAWSALANDPASHRLQVLPLKGRVRQLQRIELPAAAATAFETTHYYRLRCELPDAPNPVLVCTRIVPTAWEHRDSLDERFGGCGLFLKIGDASGPRPELVFATDRVAWFPDRLEPALDVTPTQVWLGELGFDVGLFDQVRTTNRRGLGAEDRECFYGLLAAVETTAPEDCLRRSEGPLDLQPLLASPETQQGRLLTLSGVARRVQEIPVTEADLRRRFGIDHYYEIDIFVPLGNLEVRLDAGHRGAEPAVFRNEFPVTCCVRQLPDGLPTGADVHQPVRLAGIFFKLWAYRSEFVSRVDEKQRQLAPLFIANTLLVVEPPRSQHAYLAWLVGSFFFAAAAALLIAAWLYRRSDKRFAEAMRKRHSTVPKWP